MTGAQHPPAIVDVGIPTRGRPRFLVDAVESVLAQSLSSWRLTISDNGEGGGEVARAIEPFLSDPRIVYSPTGRPIHRSANHNRLVAMGSAPYQALLHDDDRWRPECLARRVALLEEHREAGLAFAGVVNVDERGRRLFDSELVLGGGLHQSAEVLPLLLRFNCIGVPSRVLLRRSALEAVGPEFTEEFLWDDWEMWFRVASRFPTAYLRGHDCEYRVHSGQTTFLEPPDREETLRFWDHVESIVRRERPEVELGRRGPRRRRSAVLLSMALDAVQRGERGASLQALARALRAYPPSVVDPRVPAWLLAMPFGAAGGRFLARARAAVNLVGMRRGIRLHRR